MNIVFLGPPGSGKGTQAKRLADAKKLKHLSTGDIFREAIQKETALGAEIKGYVDSGRLVPDELVSEVVFEYLMRDEIRNSFLLDGFPRTFEQAKALDQFSMTKDIKIDAIFFFDVASEQLVERLSARRQCGQCKAVYNLKTMLPKTEGKCDSCGGALIQRKDDSPEVVKERLGVYNRQTLPILDHYKGRSEYKRVNAAQDVEKVFDDIMAALSPAHKPLRVC